VFIDSSERAGGVFHFVTAATAPKSRRQLRKCETAQNRGAATTSPGTPGAPRADRR